MRQQHPTQVQLAVNLNMQPVFDVLRDDLSEYYLLGEILGPDNDARPLPGAACCEQRAQAAEKRFSIQPIPPSDSSASRAAGIAPARICVVSTEAIPRKMNTPNPPPPIAAAMVAVPMVVTVATRSPARIVRAASGSSTSSKSCRSVMPIAIADSRTAASTPRMPTRVLRKIGSKA